MVLCKLTQIFKKYYTLQYFKKRNLIHTQFTSFLKSCIVIRDIHDQVRDNGILNLSIFLPTF